MITDVYIVIHHSTMSVDVLVLLPAILMCFVLCLVILLAVTFVYIAAGRCALGEGLNLCNTCMYIILC